MNLAKKTKTNFPFHVSVFFSQDDLKDKDHDSDSQGIVNLATENENSTSF